MAVQINIAAIAPALKQIVAEGIVPQFEQDTTSFSMFAEGKGDFTNAKGFRIPSYLRPPAGFSGIAEGGSFGVPGAPTFDDMYVYPFQVAMPFEITGRTLRNVNDSSSLIDGLTGLTEKTAQALRKELNFQTFNDGTGLRAVYSSGSGSATITFKNAISDTPASTFGTTKGAYFLRANQWYDQYTSAGAYVASQYVVSKTNTTATFNVSVTASSGDYWVPQGSYLKLPRGLAYIVNNDTGVFQLQSRSTYPELKAVVTDLNSAAVTVSDFSKTKYQLQVRADSGKVPNVVAITSVAQQDALTRLGQTFKRFDGNAKNFDGSFDTFSHGDTVLKVDKDCDEDRIYMVVPGDIKKYTEMPFGLYDYDGNELRMKAGTSGYGSDAYTGAFGMAYNLGTSTPRSTALIKRCSVSGLATEVSANA